MKRCDDGRVLQGLKRQHSDATIRRKNGRERRQQGRQLPEFVVHGDAQRLKHASQLVWVRRLSLLQAPQYLFPRASRGPATKLVSATVTGGIARRGRNSSGRRCGLHGLLHQHPQLQCGLHTATTVPGPPPRSYGPSNLSSEGLLSNVSK